MKNDKDNVQLNAVEDHDGILTIHEGGPGRDWNGIHYKQNMKNTILFLLLNVTGVLFLYGQQGTPNDISKKLLLP